MLTLMITPRNLLLLFSPLKFSHSAHPLSLLANRLFGFIFLYLRTCPGGKSSGHLVDGLTFSPLETKSRRNNAMQSAALQDGVFKCIELNPTPHRQTYPQILLLLCCCTCFSAIAFGSQTHVPMYIL